MCKLFSKNKYPVLSFDQRIMQYVYVYSVCKLIEYVMRKRVDSQVKHDITMESERKLYVPTYVY